MTTPPPGESIDNIIRHCQLDHGNAQPVQMAVIAGAVMDLARHVAALESKVSVPDLDPRLGFLLQLEDRVAALEKNAGRFVLNMDLTGDARAELLRMLVEKPQHETWIGQHRGNADYPDVPPPRKVSEGDEAAIADRDRLAGECEAMRKIADAANGLIEGEDWNYGNAAIRHGYRAKLIAAVLDARARGLWTAAEARTP